MLPSPASCLLCCLLRIYHLCWVSITSWFCEYCTEFTGLDCTLPAQCDVYMCPVWVCTTAIAMCYVCSLLCCTTASAVCYVCFVRVALLSAQGAMYLFVFAPLASAGFYVCLALCCTTASAVCHVCLVCAVVLPAQCAMHVLFVLHYCQWSMPLLNILQAQYAAVEHCKRSVPLLNTANAVCCCWTLPVQWVVRGLR